MSSKKKSHYIDKNEILHLENFISNFDHTEKFSISISLKYINFFNKKLTITNQEISYHYKSEKIHIKWLEIETFEIKKGLLTDVILINNLHQIKINSFHRKLIQLLDKEHCKFKRLQTLSNLYKSNINTHTPSTRPIKINHYDLYPEVVPITLVNLFKFLARDHKNQCDLILYPSILNIFFNFSPYQKKLIKKILNDTSFIPKDIIFEQIIDINHLLPIETRYSILENFYIIINQTKFKYDQEITALLRESLNIQN